MQEKTAKEILEKVRETYDEIAADFSKTRENAWPEFEKFKKYLKEDFKILDLGCGNGRLYEYLKPVEYVGMDISENLLKEARKRYPTGKFVHGDQLKIPAKNNEFDIVFSIAALHHIPSKSLRNKAVSEIKRVLKKDGILVTSVWNLFQKKYFKYILWAVLKSVFGKYEWNDTFIPWGTEKKRRYYHAFTEKELRKLLSGARFEILEFDIGNNILAICRK